ncbi:hypothetical protein EV426DRAFT_572871 [Tirmania nivea]|nr:hypothetical protein EV426DRAFT_572871 [Tirmania nivea]
MDRDDGVNDFLARIKELGAQRDREDEERTRQLEKEILAGRQARQDRRAERAKSLSPMKTGDARGSRALDGIDFSQLRSLDSNTNMRREDAVNDALDKLTGKSGPPREDPDGSDLTPPGFPRQRRPDSPWQHRPVSRGTVASENRAEFPKPEGSIPDSDNEFRRSFVTKNLASKDIGFFKQTPDRKVSSDVLLKGTEKGSSLAAKKALPGMAVDNDRGSGTTALGTRSGQEPAKRPASSYIRAHKSSPSMNGSGLSNPSKQNLFPTTDSMRFDPGSARKGSVDDTRQPAMSPSQGRIDPDWKAVSISKGMGAFAQSAKLKREGSISKRWSATLPGAISRNNTPGYNTPGGSIPHRTSRAATPIPFSRDSSPTPAPAGQPTTPEPIRREVVSRGRAKSIVESLSKYSTSGIHPARSESPKSEASPPTTPHSSQISKTFDQKRWSPTKASWLEVALKKGSEGGSPVLSKNTPVLEPPVKQADHRPAIFPKPANLPSRSVLDTVSNITTTSAALNKVTSSHPKPVSDKPPVLEKPTPLLHAKKLPPPVAEKPSSIGPKPTSGPKVELDFRGNLKNRYSATSSLEKEDLPFLDVMSRLRSTKTQKYVAPNVLKDNILAGKAALQETGAPKPKPPDPVKERLMSAKGALKNSNSSTANLPGSGLEASSNSRPIPPPPMKQASALGRIEVASLQPRVELLADKKVPNLANLLSRGPPYDRSGNFSGATTSSSGKSYEEPEKEIPGGDGPLTHMTKTRARGPKRRQPTKAQAQEEGSRSNASLAPLKPPLKPKPSKEVLTALTRVPSICSVKGALVDPSEADISGPETVESRLALKTSSEEIENIKMKPPTPAKSPMLIAKTDFKPLPNVTPIPSPSVEMAESLFSLDLPDGDPPKSNVVAMAEPAADPPFIERPIQPPAMSWLARRTSSARASGPQRAPFKPPQLEKIEEPLNAPAKLSLRLPMVEDEEDVSDVKPKTLPPTPAIVKATDSLAPGSGVSKVSYGSIPKHVDELNSFFKDPESFNIKMDVDIFKLLPPKVTQEEKLETVKLDVWEVTVEGKVQAIEPRNQHILFDQNMYMCLHIFEKFPGDRDAEFYLWSGNQVSAAAVDDAQIFAKKMAGENDATMTVVKQGHETPGFLRALGGILITRRGNAKSASASPYILCGRSLYDGIAFDEEDLRDISLCSGFPFLIHSGEGVYLWKGIGSSPRELAYGRKVATDLTSGDFEDVDEGSEPQALLDLLQNGIAEKAAAKYWAMKPSHDNYVARLFKCDMQSEQIVTEISPFCQNDIELANIYILDAFFELYIVLGANSQAKRVEFQIALQFTQEYSKAVHSMYSRPFMPPTFVLLGGVSREFKAVFRSWQPNHIPTTWAPSRKPSLRVIGLNDAMKAMNMAE